MRTLYLLTTIYIGLALISCTTETNKPTPSRPIPSTAYTYKKNPLAIALYTKNHPNSSYKVIGKGTISKYNSGGNKRQEASIRDNLRELAAAMGGDGIINIKRDEKSITGTIIAYQKNNAISEG